MKLALRRIAVVMLVLAPLEAFSADRQAEKPLANEVLKESYTQQQQDLRNAATKVKDFNKKKKQIRDANKKKRSNRRKKN